MIKAAIEKLIACGGIHKAENGRELVIGDFNYITPALIDTITVHTLTSLVNAWHNDPIIKDMGAFFVVESPVRVEIVSQVQPGKVRHIIYGAEPFGIDTVNPDNMQHWHSIDDFILQFRKHFQNDAGSAEILRLVSSLVRKGEETIKDNGITQVATVKTGITTVGTQNVGDVVMLRSAYMFPEIDEPQPYFLRLKSQGNDEIQAALFSAASKVVADSVIMDKIRQYLRDNTDAVVI
jgi:hypothetical protein